MEELKYSFKVSCVPSPKTGTVYHILTATEFPYACCQIVPIPEGKWDAAVEQMKGKGLVAGIAGRKDFVAMHVGWGQDIEITEENQKLAAAALNKCVQDAAGWWILHESEYKDNETLHLRDVL